MLKRSCRFWVTAALLSVICLSYIPLRLAIAQQHVPQPQLIFMLGGSQDREEFTAQLAHLHPDLKVWVSTGTQAAGRIFENSGISLKRVLLDCRATDTVTNFTTVVEDFKQRRIQHVYLVTSDTHMPRAIAIATIVFGSQGITFTPIKIPSVEPSESLDRAIRDVGRSLVWVVTRRTGSRFNGRNFSCR